MKTEDRDLFGNPTEPTVAEYRRAYRLCHLRQSLESVLSDPAGRILLRNVARHALKLAGGRTCSPRS